MIGWLKKRAKEASTYAGMGTAIIAGSILAKAPELKTVGNTVMQQQDQLASGNYGGFIAALMLSLAAMFAPENGNR